MQRQRVKKYLSIIFLKLTQWKITVQRQRVNKIFIDNFVKTNTVENHGKKRQRVNKIFTDNFVKTNTVENHGAKTKS